MTLSLERFILLFLSCILDDIEGKNLELFGSKLNLIEMRIFFSFFDRVFVFLILTNN